VIDFAVLSAVFFPVTRVVKGVWLMERSDHLWGWGRLVTDPLCIIFLGAIFLYFIVAEGLFGATVGKRAVHIRVVGADGSPIDFRQAVVRNLLRLVDGLPALNILGVVLILRSSEGARFGDRVAATRVVRY
jgi:uncharacterized RDD family membrane protein YckC